MLEELTDDQLAEYHLAWVHDYGGPSLRYAGRCTTSSASPSMTSNAMLEDGASNDDIVLFLHEIASDIDEEDEANRQVDEKSAMANPAPDQTCHQQARAGTAAVGSPAVEEALAMTTRASTTAGVTAATPEAEGTGSPFVASGPAVCWRCGRAIQPDGMGSRPRRLRPQHLSRTRTRSLQPLSSR